MPEESNKLLASILGSSSTENPEQGETTDVTSIISTTNPDDTSAITSDDSSIEVPTETSTAEDTQTDATATNSDTTTTNDAEVPSTTTPTITIDQARTSLNMIAQNSKKILSEALKAKQKEA